MTGYDSAFRDASDRVAHAWQHIELFRTTSNAHMQPGPYELKVYEKREGEFIRFSWRYVVTGDPMPNALRHIFGDAVHNLRSACDNIITSLCLIHGRKPTGRYFFPVSRELGIPGPKGSGFNKWRTDNSSLPSAFLDALETLQPFHPYAGTHGPLSDSRHPLFILSELWNCDKHKMPLGIVDFTNASKWDLPIIGDTDSHSGLIRLYDLKITPGHRVQNGAELLQVRVRRDSGFSPSNYQFGFTTQICLDENSPVAPGEIAYQVLNNSHNFVRDEVIERLKAACI